MTNRQTQEQAIAADLNLCDIGAAFTKGKNRQAFVAHRKACMAQIAAWNAEDGINLTDDELFAELAA
jgi:hypothetical protein